LIVCVNDFNIKEKNMTLDEFKNKMDVLNDMSAFIHKQKNELTDALIKDWPPWYETGEDTIYQAMAKVDKIIAIKTYRDKNECTLREAKNYIDELMMDRRDISDV